MKPLRFGIPKGSLEQTTIELLRKSGWRVSSSSRSYFPSIDDEEIVCSLVRAQEMSRYVEAGSLDCGITGKDWTLENGSDIEVVCDLVYSKASFRPTRWVLAVAMAGLILVGWRGATRYYHPDYREGFALECRAIRATREIMGLTNVVVMIPFCRTLEEAEIQERQGPPSTIRAAPSCRRM